MGLELSIKCLGPGTVWLSFGLTLGVSALQMLFYITLQINAFSKAPLPKIWCEINAFPKELLPKFCCEINAFSNELLAKFSCQNNHGLKRSRTYQCNLFYAAAHWVDCKMSVPPTIQVAFRPQYTLHYINYRHSSTLLHKSSGLVKTDCLWRVQQ